MHPFSSDDGPIEPVSDCVRLELDVRRGGGTFARSTVEVSNDCRHGVAILTTPLELRVRRTDAERFPSQSLFTAAHATFYVAPARVGLSSDMFFGDGGKIVYGRPGYTTAPAGARVSIPILGADRLLIGLPDGETSVALVTAVVPVSVDDRRADPFDLALDVGTMNLRAKQRNDALRLEPFRISRRAQELSATTTF
ncbi:MAG TPA: hypothetical protein VF911_21620 [Thermoanaerobaculia bacterium]